MKTSAKVNGYIIHKGTTNNNPFVVIATTKTANIKTGNMIQIWIMLSDIDPVKAVQSGTDAQTICTGCPFASGNGCYINMGQAPLAIYNAYHKGKYPYLKPSKYKSVFENRVVRFGAYGNPTLIPLAKVKRIASLSNGWTGYFHNWLTMQPMVRKAYSRYFMLSTETKDSFAIATKLGLRVFHASPIQPDNTVECVSDSHGIKCEKCKLCCGSSKNAKSVWISPHGSTVNRALVAIG